MSAVQSISADILIKRWMRREYVRLYRLGMLGDQKVELIGGIIEVSSPQMLPHAIALSLTAKALEAAFGDTHLVLTQTTVNLGPGSMPDPDVFVIEKTGDPNRREYPRDPLLIVEISDTTLRRDRVRKGSLYAKHGVQEFWIVNLNASQLEVYRQPRSDKSQPFGHGDASTSIFHAGDVVSPLAAGNASVTIADLFPK